MFYQLELLLLGVATVFDTVLLLIVLERVNRPQISSWLYALLVGLWLIHGSSFVHQLLRDVPGSAGVAQVLVWFTCVGLLVLPSAMLHAALWLNFGRQEHRWRYALLYLPVLCLPGIAWHLATTTATNFIEAVAPLARIYLSAVVLCNLLSIGLFLRVGKRISSVGSQRFFTRLAILLAWLTIVILFYYRIATQQSSLEEVTRAVLILSPLLPALLFVWHALNQRLLPLVMERTLLYGATVVVLLFVHRLLIEPLASSVQARAHVDILMIEGWLLIALVIAWPPLRSRFREAVRYLLSSNVHQIRQATRTLSVEMSQLAWQSTEELCEWMADALRRAIDVDTVTITLSSGSDEPVRMRSGINEDSNTLVCVTSRCASATGSVEFDHRVQDELATLTTALNSAAQPYLFRGQRLPHEVQQAMARLGILWAFRMQFRSVHGMVLVGPRKRNDRLAEEQLISLSLLIEQFAATLHNRHLEQLRLSSERRAMQNEKLSMLGLLSGTISHELRNPLSSMRTIAQLMLEDLGSSNPHARDLSMILGEIDRLTQTTSRLLDFSRPASDHSDTVDPDRVLTRLLTMLEHLALQHSVLLEVKMAGQPCLVACSDASLSEILFNLIKNAIEAATHPCMGTGKVSVETSATMTAFICVISDNGPGISDQLQAVMFEPFVTAKTDGTGLGLYIVGQRLRELRGTIDCASQPGQGTRFEIRLPRALASGAEAP